MSSPARLARVAVVQAAPVAFDLEATLGKVERVTAECAEGGAELVLFPEAFVSCYPRGLTRSGRASAHAHARAARGSAASGSRPSTFLGLPSTGSERSHVLTASTS